jgi:hypothetical protein
MICIVAMFTNLAGWVLWRLYITPEIYNAAFIFLNVWALYELFHKDNEDDLGDSKLGSGPTFLHRLDLSRSINLQKNGKTT